MVAPLAAAATSTKLCLGAGLAMALWAAAPVHAAQKALVVGIDDYRSARDLNGPRYDAQNFASFLERKWGYDREDIRLLLDGQATRQAFLDTAQRWLVERTQPGDEVLIYYSGHGVQTRDASGDEPDGYDEALALHDVEIVEGEGFRNLVLDDDVEALVDRLPGRRVQLVIDSCHSGDIARSLDGFEDIPENSHVKTLFNPYLETRNELADLDAYRADKGFMESSKDLVVWTAASSFQTAFTDMESNQGSVFTNRFVSGVVEGIADANGDGVVSATELFDHVTEESREFCERNSERCRLGLTPTLEASAGYYLAAMNRPSGEAATVAAGTPANEALVARADSALSRMKRGDVRLTMQPGHELALGQKIKLQVSSDTDGYLLVLDIDPAGRITQVFPNRFSEREGVSNRVRRGQTIVIPDPAWGFDLQAVPPGGDGVLYAVLVEDDLELAELIEANKDLEVIDNPNEYLSELAARLRETWSDGNFNRAAKWSVARENYHISE